MKCVVVSVLLLPPGTEWRAERPRAGESGESAAAWFPQAGSCLRCRREAARPSEPSQCWTWRWCLNALWGTSNGSSRSVSVGSFQDPIYWPLLLSGPFRCWALPQVPLRPRLSAFSYPLVFWFQALDTRSSHLSQDKRCPRLGLQQGPS